MSLAYNISAKNREKKWKIFLEKVNPAYNSKILDVGYTDKEYTETDNYLEKHYAYPNKIVALGVEEPGEFSERYPKVKVVKYEGDLFPFKDKEFDVCWSNATIEHVGGREKQILFLKEIARVSRMAFLTTPNKNFPIEVHTRTPLLHFLPKTIFDLYLTFVGKRWATGDYMSLLTLGGIKKILKKAGIKKYKIIKNKFWGFTLDFVIIFGSK